MIGSEAPRAANFFDSADDGPIDFWMMDPNERDIAGEPRRRTRRRMNEYGRPRRPWLLVVASLLLAGLTAWTGFQWRQGAHREVRLRAELKQVYLEAEQLRAQAVQSQQRAFLLQKQIEQLESQLQAARPQAARRR